jgi:hypothetical protein
MGVSTSVQKGRIYYQCTLNQLIRLHTPCIHIRYWACIVKMPLSMAWQAHRSSCHTPWQWNKEASTLSNLVKMHTWKLDSSTKWQATYPHYAFKISSTLVCSCVHHVSKCVVLHAFLPNQKVQATKKGLQLIPLAIKSMVHWIICRGNRQKASLRIQPMESRLPEPFQ